MSSFRTKLDCYGTDLRARWQHCAIGRSVESTARHNQTDILTPAREIKFRSAP